MAKERKIEKPTAPLSIIIDDLTKYNGLYFQLRQGTEMLLDAIKTGDMKRINAVVEVCNLEATIESLKIFV